MKKKFFYSLILLVFAFTLSWVMAIPAIAAVTIWYVDDDGGYDFKTIQDAVNMASDGDIILVRDGTYYEHIVVNKEVQIKAEMDHSPIVDGGGSGTCFNIYRGGGMDEVGIKDFKIRNADYGIWIYGDPSPYNDITIRNNHIHDITNNGIYVTDATVTGFNIEKNLLDNCGFGVAFSNGAVMVDVFLEGNSLNNNNVGLGVLAVSASNVVVSHCSFEGNAWEHIDLGVGWTGWTTVLSNINVNMCDFFGGPWCAIYINSMYSKGDIVIEYNNFYGLNDVYGVFNITSTSANAEHNWWGHASGPGGAGGRVNKAGKVIGKGADIDGPVRWDPWLVQELDHTKHSPVPPGWD